MQIVLRHTFHWNFRKYMVEWERKISWMVELACKLRIASLTRVLMTRLSRCLVVMNGTK
jgi:hypothetical protein